jgi:hypothetical protein
MIDGTFLGSGAKESSIDQGSGRGGHADLSRFETNNEAS